MNTHVPITSYFRSRVLRIVASIFLFTALSRAEEGGRFYLKDGDRVLFYGDSITEQRFYTNFVETYVITRFPHLKVSFVNSGWGGDRVTGGGGGPIDLRLNRDIFAYHPNVVTIMLGMNDGTYAPFNQTIADTYENGYKHILQEVETKLPGVRLTLILPSPFDDITRPVTFEHGYNSVLLRYGAIVQALAANNKQTTADFNSAVNEVLAKAMTIDPQLAQSILADRVHPSVAGHLPMAEALLKAWNAPSVVSEVGIDETSRRVTLAANTKIDHLEFAESIAWDQTDNCLPMPVDTQNPLVALVLKSSDFVDAIDREILRVTNLRAPFYELSIDGDTVGVFNRDDLSKGINLATLETPMSSQAAEVHRLTVMHNDLHFNRWRAIQLPLLSKNNATINQSLPPILDALDAEEQGVIEQQRAKALPVLHHYVLTPQQESTTGDRSDPVVPPHLGANLALHKKYASSNPNPNGWDPGLTDGSWTEVEGQTYATDDQAGFPKTVTIDLETSQSVGFVLLGVPSFGSTRNISVSLSPDNLTFTKVGSTVFPQGATTRHLYKFPAVMARYIRLTYPNHYEAPNQFSPNYVFTTEVEAYSPAEK